jgi:hypothetical protein
VGFFVEIQRIFDRMALLASTSLTASLALLICATAFMRCSVSAGMRDVGLRFFRISRLEGRVVDRELGGGDRAGAE